MHFFYFLIVDLQQLSYYTNQSFWAIAKKDKKKKKNVEANTKNISTKSQPYVPYGSLRRLFLKIFF